MGATQIPLRVFAIRAAALSGSAQQSDYRFDFEDENQTVRGRLCGSAKDGECVAVACGILSAPAQARLCLNQQGGMKCTE
jgi:hypothetical protein